jgi:HK97 family phage major capsid protein
MTTATALQDTLSRLYAEQEELTAGLRKVNDQLEAGGNELTGHKSAELTEKGQRLADGLNRLEAKIAETRGEWQAAVLAGLDAGVGGREAGAGPGSGGYKTPASIARPLEDGETMVDRLKAMGRKVNDAEWRLGVLGAIATGRGDKIAKLMRHSDGTSLPDKDGGHLSGAETKDMLTSSGGNVVLVPDVVSAEIIDRLRPASVVTQLGARVVPMRATTEKVPRITGDPTISWLAEGATVTATDAVVDHVLLTSRRLTGLTKVSQELVEDSDPVEVGRVLSTSFGGAIATELDRVALKGSGTPPEPSGIRNESGVSVNATAAATTWAVVNERVGVLIGANVPFERIGIALNNTSWTALYGLVGSDGHPVSTPDYLANTRILATSNLAGPATGELYAGDYSEVLIGTRIALDFQVLRERYADEGKVGFLPRVRADVAVRHGASFALRTALST